LTRAPARREIGAFLVEGPQAVREALSAGTLLELFATPGAVQRHADLAALAPQLHLVDDRALESLSDTVTPQGLVGVSPLLTVDLPTALRTRPDLVAVLAGVADPGNAGTVVRAADAAGAGALIFAAGSVDPHVGKCVRASAGSLWHLPVAEAGSLEEVYAALRDAGLQIFATASGGQDLSDPELDLARPTAWVFGNEARGLGQQACRDADRVVGVPILGRAESLNLATAAALCLYARTLRNARIVRAPTPTAGRWQTAAKGQPQPGADA
jgi:TrmH family RNA methyltransferase